LFDWNDLVFFLELARQGRLAPVARRLKVDHTTVSRRIAELEKDLSVKLFDRNRDGFVLTERGHRLFDIAERIEQDAASVEPAMGADNATAAGRVRLVTMEGIGAFFLASRFAELNSAYEIVGDADKRRTVAYEIMKDPAYAVGFAGFEDDSGQRFHNFCKQFASGGRGSRAGRLRR